MPKGKFVNHKGKNRRFTNPEELEQQRKKDEQERQWRSQRGEVLSDEEEEDESGPSGDKPSRVKGEGSESESESSSGDESRKAKGVSDLIEIENPNRIVKKSKKISKLGTEMDASKPELSRREREEIEKQKARAQYLKMHAEGKTEQARADLARLAIIKQQREEAQKMRDLEKKKKEEAAKVKSEQTNKALGKKT